MSACGLGGDEAMTLSAQWAGFSKCTLDFYYQLPIGTQPCYNSKDISLLQSPTLLEFNKLSTFTL